MADQKKNPAVPAEPPADTDERFMELARAQALLAMELDETPVGCVIVRDGAVVGQGHNRRNTEKNPLAHGEIIAIDQACRAVGDWRLEDCTLYATIEPCPMCAGAIVQARIPRVVYGAANPKAGSAGSVLDILAEPRLNHRVSVTAGVLEEPCAALMRAFFSRLRQK